MSAPNVCWNTFLSLTIYVLQIVPSSPTPCAKSRLSLVMFIHSSVYMSIPISQFILPPLLALILLLKSFPILSYFSLTLLACSNILSATWGTPNRVFCFSYHSPVAFIPCLVGSLLNHHLQSCVFILLFLDLRTCEVHAGEVRGESTYSANYDHKQALQKSLHYTIYSLSRLVKLLYVHVCTCSVVSNSLQLHGLKPVRLLCLWNFPGKKYWSGFPFPIKGIFPSQGSNLSLASPALAGGFFTTCATCGVISTLIL